MQYSFLFIFMLLSINQALIGNEWSSESAVEHWRKGENAFQEYEYNRSLELFNKAAKNFKKSENWRDYVLVLCRIAENQDKLELFSEMRATGEEAVEVACRYLTEDERVLGRAYHLLGEAHWVEAIFYDLSIERKDSLLSKAIGCFELAESLYKEGGYWEELIENHINMAFIRLHTHKELEKVQSYSWEVIRLAEEKLAAVEFDSLRNLSCVRAYGILGKVEHRFLGDYDKALKYNYLSLDYRLRLPNKHSKDKIWLAYKYKEVAEIYGAKMDREQMIFYLKKAEELIQTHPKHEIAFHIYQRMSLYYWRAPIPDYNKALEYQLKVKDVVTSIDFTPRTRKKFAMLWTYTHLLHLYITMNDMDKATYWLEQASNHLAENFKEKNISYELYVYWVVRLLYWKKQNQLEEALKVFESEVEGINSSDFQRTGIIHSINLGKMYGTLGRYKEALHYLNIGLGDMSINKDAFLKYSYKNLPLNINILSVLCEKAKLLNEYYYADGNQEYLEAAFDTYLNIFEYAEVMRKKLSRKEGRKLLSGITVTIYEEAIAVALELYKLTKNTYYQEQALLFSEKSKVGLLLEEIVDQYLKSDFVPDSLLQIEQKIQKDLAFYEQLLYKEKAKSKKDSLKIGVWQKKLVELRRREVEFEKELRDNYPRYYQLKHNFKRANAKDIQGVLNFNQFFIEFFWGEEELYVFGIQSDSSEGQANLMIHRVKDVELLQSEVEQLITYSQDPNSSITDYTNASYSLYQKLLKPFLTQIGNEIEELVIVPDGMLGYLPFEALIVKEPNDDLSRFNIQNQSYLVKDFHVSYTYSGSLFFQYQNTEKLALKPIQTNEALIAYAPTFYGDSNGLLVRSCSENLTSLDCAAIEVESIGEQLKGETLIGDKATKQHFLEKAMNSPILHLATHACMDDEDSDFNRIYFANEEYLTSLELYTLQLQTQLTVLSACNTGSGQLVKGEGIMSLARGFIAAGCPSLVTTLWGVNDCATKRLMSHFYQHLYNGENKAQALRNAKLDFLKDEETTRQELHPFYWAGFVQLGESSAIFQKEKNKFIAWQSNLLGVFFLTILVAGWFVFGKRTGGY